MNDTEIIKALECCITDTCICCPCDDVGVYSQCVPTLLENALDLINRQKAEIEECKLAVNIAEEERNRLLNHYLFDTNFGNGTPLQRARAEAVKEFAERLCEGRVSNDPVVIATKCLVKEFTEGKTGV